MKMSLNRTIVYLLLAIGLCGGNVRALAQDFSYVYIQGDKKTPIYVKVEGEMLPRYGKNYALISRLAPGPLNIDILFQQNEHPPMHYTILVPEHGKRAFMINKKEGAFCLYDLEQNFYLKPDNDISDDHLPTVISSGDLAAAPVKEPVANDSRQEETTPPVSQKTAKTAPRTNAKKTTVKKAVAPATPEPPQPKDAAPQFIDNITFNNDNTAVPAAAEQAETSGKQILNSDCSGVIPDNAFRRLIISIDAKETEDEKLGTFLESVNQYCFTTDMTSQVVAKLSTDAARFSALKKVYPKTTDQSHFEALEQLLSDAEWKEYFRDMVHH